MDASIKIKNLFKQLTVSGFESFLLRVQSDDKAGNASYTNKYQEYIRCGFVDKAMYIDHKLSKPVILYRGKNEVNK